MNISARVQNSPGSHEVTLRTNEHVHSIAISPKSTGHGSSTNGGELLFLALATCYCNDIYREAQRRGMNVTSVEVTVEGEFGAEGEPAKDVVYSVKVAADEPDGDVRELAAATDRLAEIQNTLRVGTPVTLKRIEVMGV